METIEAGETAPGGEPRRVALKRGLRADADSPACVRVCLTDALGLVTGADLLEEIADKRRAAAAGTWAPSSVWENLRRAGPALARRRGAARPRPADQRSGVFAPQAPPVPGMGPREARSPHAPRLPMRAGFKKSPRQCQDEKRPPVPTYAANFP